MKICHFWSTPSEKNQHQPRLFPNRHFMSIFLYYKPPPTILHWIFWDNNRNMLICENGYLTFSIPEMKERIKFLKISSIFRCKKYPLLVHNHWPKLKMMFNRSTQWNKNCSMLTAVGGLTNGDSWGAEEPLEDYSPCRKHRTR